MGSSQSKEIYLEETRTRVSPEHTEEWPDWQALQRTFNSMNQPQSYRVICLTFRFLDESISWAELGPCANLDQGWVGTCNKSPTKTVCSGRKDSGTLLEEGGIKEDKKKLLMSILHRLLYNNLKTAGSMACLCSKTLHKDWVSVSLVQKPLRLYLSLGSLLPKGSLPPTFLLKCKSYLRALVTA